ncbi:hypothetical protein CRM22_004877 [Opisthorchis felineus]|uniref:DM10 domain-containing protein n=1 Tax=Opisthorchis felineus TaxID=147828 RepID=A0A4S2LTY0_OPIFE|nr:hypothetical protein CRM22_004877 [Opisthorchis felineus]
MMEGKGPTYSFIVEYYDPYSTTIKKYVLLYHSGGKSVEMHDQRLNRLFLKPTKMENIKLSDLYLGSCVTVLSRTLRVVDFADNFTRKALCRNSERCVAFIRPDSACRAGEILSYLEEKGFRLVNLKIFCPTSDETTALVGNLVDYTKLPHFLTELAEMNIVAVEVMANNACAAMRELVGGPSGPEKGTSFVSSKDLLVFATDPESSAAQAEMIFGNPGGPRFRGSARLKGTTLAIIKPHAVSDGLTGSIWTAIRERGFCISAARLYRLSKADAAEFLEVYKGVAHEYPEMLDQLASGPCVALEIATTEEGVDVQKTFREFVGPLDPEIAKFLRPQTLRAKFGVDKIRNAVHCTDLPEDTELEVNFFFRILDK